MFVQDEDLEWIEVGEAAIAFRRGSGAVCLVNFGPAALRLPEGEILLTSAPVFDNLLPPNTAAWLQPPF